MSDVNSTGNPQGQDGAPPSPVRILGQYVKDLSFEVPHAPEIYNLLRQQGPDIPITIDTAAKNLGGTTFEVTLSITLEATLADKKAFILEVVYGSVVEVNDQVVPQEHVHPMLLIEMPRQMFPFVRQIISELTVNGGFPPLMLQMVDFADMYRRKFGLPGEPKPEGDAAPVH